MSTKSWSTRLGAVVLVAVGGYFTFMSCDVADGLRGDRDDPRLVTAGAAGGQEWAVVKIGEEAFTDCFEFRADGVRKLKLCGTTRSSDGYAVGVARLRGVTMFVGVLPDAAAHAEIGLESKVDGLPRKGKSATVPVEVHTFGKSVRYVVGPMPAGAQWREGERVPLVVTDGQGTRLTP